MSEKEVDLKIYLRAKDLKIPQIDRAIADQITKGITESNGKIRAIVAALINIHKRYIDDTTGLQEKFARMSLDVHPEEFQQKHDLALICRNVPEDSTYLNSEGKKDITKLQKERIAKAIRDVILLPPFTPDDVVGYVRQFVERTGMLAEEPRLRTFVWGGHALPNERMGIEYNHCRELAYYDALSCETEFITGCGEGVMRAPFSGANVAYRRQMIEEKRKAIGFTEQKILAAEPPNAYVNRMIVFPNIAQRIIGFVLASHRGRVHPGGAGTIEEIMSFLAIKSHPNNRDLEYPFDLVEPKGAKYMQGALSEYLSACFGDKLDSYYQIHTGIEPSQFPAYLQKTNAKLNPTQLWNKDIYIPAELCAPFEVNFENMEKINLNKDQVTADLIINLRNFYSAIVYLTIKNPSLVESWGKDLPLIHGDKGIIQATDRLITKLAVEGRMKQGVFKKPYRIK